MPTGANPLFLCCGKAFRLECIRLPAPTTNHRPQPSPNRPNHCSGFEYYCNSGVFNNATTSLLGFPGRNRADSRAAAPVGAQYWWAASWQPSSNMKYQKNVLAQVRYSGGTEWVEWVVVVVACCCGRHSAVRCATPDAAGVGREGGCARRRFVAMCVAYRVGYCIAAVASTIKPRVHKRWKLGRQGWQALLRDA